MEHDERVWMRWAAAFVALELAFVAILAYLFPVAGDPPLVLYFRHVVPIVVLIAAAILAIDLFALLHVRPNRPTIWLFTKIIARRTRLAVLVCGLGLYCLQSFALTWSKTTIPVVTRFWADAPLANLEAKLFGEHPWMILRAIPGRAVIDVTYMTWLPTILTGLAVLLLSRPCPEKARACLGFFLAMGLLGVFGQYALPSTGPIFWNQTRLSTEYVPIGNMTASASTYLWSMHQKGVVGFATGISAFPSIHVAMTTWLALSLTRIHARVAPFAWVYWAMIAFGSVYLGWHYVSDGVAGALGAVLCYQLAGALLKLNLHVMRRSPRLT